MNEFGAKFPAPVDNCGNCFSMIDSNFTAHTLCSHALVLNTSYMYDNMTWTNINSDCKTTKISCGFFPAVQVHVLKGDKAGEWWKFTINIISVYKQGEHRIRRGDQLLWVRAKDVACKCPKIKPGRKYLLLGSDDEDSRGQSGVVADKASLLVPWKDQWARRLRKFQQRDKRGKC